MSTKRNGTLSYLLDIRFAHIEKPQLVLEISHTTVPEQTSNLLSLVLFARGIDYVIKKKGHVSMTNTTSVTGQIFISLSVLSYSVFFFSSNVKRSLPTPTHLLTANV